MLRNVPYMCHLIIPYIGNSRKNFLILGISSLYEESKLFAVECNNIRLGMSETMSNMMQLNIAKNILIIFLFVQVFISCEKNYDPVTGTNNTIENNAPKQLEIFPKKGGIGTKIEISGLNNRQYEFGIRVIFQDSLSLRPDSTNKNKIYAYVPFKAKSGEIKVTSQRDTGIVSFFGVTDSCSDVFCVKEWDLNYSVTKENSAMYNFLGGLVYWQGEIKGDTIIQTLINSVGDISDYKKELKFVETPNNNLPTFISGDTRSYPGGSIRIKIESAIIKIQSWDLNGIVAGSVLYNVCGTYFFNEKFWYDFTSIN